MPKVENATPHQVTYAKSNITDAHSATLLYQYRDKLTYKCNAGYKGRVGIYEVVKITPQMSRIIMEDGNSIELAKQAKEHGFNDLRRSGLEKVMQGMTSISEADRVTTEQ